MKLTRREKEVLDGILRSLANKEIASELNLSERTVKFHVSSLLSKFKVHSRMELMREASQPCARTVPAPAGEFRRLHNRSPVFQEHEIPGKMLNSGKVLPLARHRMMA